MRQYVVMQFLFFNVLSANPRNLQIWKSLRSNGACRYCESNVFERLFFITNIDENVSEEMHRYNSFDLSRSLFA